MKPFKTITDPDAFQLLADETRRKIIYLLRAKEMNVAQIAEDLGLTPQAIYHHIHKMKDKDLVEVAREERTGHFIETYYRATAEVFYMSHGESTSSGSAEKSIAEAIKALPRLGFNVEADPSAVARMVEIERRLSELGEKGKWSERMGGLEDVDFVTKQEVAHLANLLTMTDVEFNEYLKLYKEFRKTLKSTALVTVPVASRKA